MMRLTVDLGERSYPILLGSGLLAEMGTLLQENGIQKNARLFVITDSNVAERHLGRVMRLLQEAGYQASSAVVPAGEKSKSLSMLEDLIGQMLKAGLDRHSVVIALGGGVVGDLAGFVAASYMRGIRFVQVPTTILAHDSSVGGKVAVNHPYAKNIIGAFHQPELVLYDMDTLMTLPDRDVRSGLSEVIKHGLIWDAEFVTWCENHVEALLNKDAEALQQALYHGCKVKAAVVSQDERENNLRAILNLGHTIGHALEAVAGYNELLHGEAISIGMVGSAWIAQRFGVDPEVGETTERLFRKFQLPVRIPAHFDTEKIMEAMQHDKKFKDGKMVFVLPTAIGTVEIRNDVLKEWVVDVVERLKLEG